MFGRWFCPVVVVCFLYMGPKVMCFCYMGSGLLQSGGGGGYMLHGGCHMVVVVLYMGSDGAGFVT